MHYVLENRAADDVATEEDALGGENHARHKKRGATGSLADKLKGVDNGEASGIPQSEKMTPMIGPRTTGLRKERPIASTMAPAPLLPEAAALFASRIPRVSGYKKIEPTAMDRATETMFAGPNTAAISGSPAAALFGKAIVKAWIAASPDGRRKRRRCMA
jgi:hypothetical protein